jgi:hypothetical protein
MIRYILAAGCAACLLAAPGIVLAQSETSTYGDTMRKHSAKAGASSAHNAKLGTSGATGKKSAGTTAKASSTKHHSRKG